MNIIIDKIIYYIFSFLSKLLRDRNKIIIMNLTDNKIKLL